MFVLIFILILAVLVFVHELGHFVVARRNGIGASEFGFGFPPRIFGVVKSDKNNRWRFVWGSRDVKSKNTVYSLNWIPLGGFVKIKGEDGGHKSDEDSFAAKGAWVRVKVLAAGVIMNFILAWLLISIVLMLGAPESVDNSNNTYQNSSIKVAAVLPDAPAAAMGLKVGDEISKNQIDPTGKKITLTNVSSLQNYIKSEAGEKLTLTVKRGASTLNLSGTPRVNAPENQGSLGISLAEVVVTKYPFYSAFWKAIEYLYNLVIEILVGLYGVLASLISGHGVSADVSGPVGIAVLTREVANLGIVYLLQFAALLSINLGIINILPIPALDGGRIFFVLIEKIKGSPVNQKVEQIFHTAFFILLLSLMALVTFKDVMKFFK